MKQSLACPKCGSRTIWRVDEMAAQETGGTAALVRPAVRRTDPTRAGFLGQARTYTCGYVDAYICAGCGYTELWSRDFAELVDHPEGGVHRLEAGDGGDRPR